MTELQKAEFELLRQFTQICETLELPWFLVCGSALGAVKYGGFIPWDDDIDIGMPREAYEIFLQEAGKHLPDHVFLQNYKTDPRLPILYSKLRNSKTTFIEHSSSHLPIHHGIYIDIFPLDGYPDSPLEAGVFELRKRICSSQANSAFHLELPGKSKWLAALWRLMGYHRRTGKTIARYTKLISQYKIQDSRLICNHGNWQGKLEYAPKAQYGNGAEAMFEGLRVRIPEGYDAYLTQKYGDWHRDLPEDQQKSHHACVVCDPDRPYTVYTGEA